MLRFSNLKRTRGDKYKCIRNTHKRSQSTVYYSTYSTNPLMLFTFSYSPPSSYFCLFHPHTLTPMCICAGTAFPQAFRITLLYVLALCSTNGIVSLRSTCKQEPVTVAMVARQRRGNGGDVKNMSCKIESASAVL